MEYTNEFLAGMYGAYYGCKCRMVQDNNNFNLNAKVDPMNIQRVLSGRYQSCKLLLKQLSSITDEDATQVAKMAIGEHPFTIDRSTEKVVKVKAIPDVSYLSIAEPNHIFICTEKEGDTDFLPIPNNVSIIDYLRAKGYDCGYSGFNNGEFKTVPSLTEEGLAIDITTLNK